MHVVSLCCQKPMACVADTGFPTQHARPVSILNPLNALLQGHARWRTVFSWAVLMGLLLLVGGVLAAVSPLIPAAAAGVAALLAWRARCARGDM